MSQFLARILIALSVLCVAPAQATQTTLVTPGAPLTMANLATFLNNAFLTLGGCSSGASAPAPVSAAPITYQCWMDTTADPRVLKIYDGTTWVSIANLSSSGHTYQPIMATIQNGAGTLTLPTTTTTLVGRSTTDTLTNKTYDTAGTGNSFLINGVAVTANTGTGAMARATSPVFATPAIAGSSSGQTNFAVAAAASGTLTFPSATDTLVGKATTDTLTNKTLTSPTISGGTANALGSLSLVNSGFNQGFVSGGTLSGNRNWTLNLNDAARSMSQSGDLTFGGQLTISGSSAWTINIGGTSNTTIPAGTHTLAGLDVAQTWSAVQQFNSGDLKFAGGTSGLLTMNCALVCGTNTITWPAGTTDFSATGGTSQVLKQTSAGGAITVGQLAPSDLSGSGATAVVLGSRTINSGNGISGGGDLTASRTISSSRVRNAQTGTTYTVVDNDGGKIVTLNNASAVAVTLPQPGGTFASGWESDFVNLGAGTVTITPTSATINGSASLSLITGQGVHIFSDGTNYVANLGSGAGAVTSVVCGTTTITSSGNCYLRGQIVGTNTNDNATAGNFGEVISSSVASGSAVSLTNNTPANMTSISLTAGDWDVFCNVIFLTTGTTVYNYFVSSINTTTATVAIAGGQYYSATYATAGIANSNLTNIGTFVGPYHASLSGTTTHYCVAQSGFSVSTASAYGLMYARRMR